MEMSKVNNSVRILTYVCHKYYLRCVQRIFLYRNKRRCSLELRYDRCACKTESAGCFWMMDIVKQFK